MDALYRDPRLAGSFDGVEAVRRYSKKSRKDVKKHLASVDAYTLHKPLRTSFLRRRTYSKGIADLAQVDLVDVLKYAAFNDGYRYILTCIDVFLSGPGHNRFVRNLVAKLQQLLNSY